MVSGKKQGGVSYGSPPWQQLGGIWKGLSLAEILDLFEFSDDGIPFCKGMALTPGKNDHLRKIQRSGLIKLGLCDIIVTNR